VVDGHYNNLAKGSVTSDFWGFRGLVHGTGDFPLVEQNGFLIKPGTDVMIFKIYCFTVGFCKIEITMLAFEKNANFFRRKWQKWQGIVIISKHVAISSHFAISSHVAISSHFAISSHVVILSHQVMLLFQGM
jgi:hypothetical protein